MHPDVALARRPDVRVTVFLALDGIPPDVIEKLHTLALSQWLNTPRRRRWRDRWRERRSEQPPATRAEPPPYRVRFHRLRRIRPPQQTRCVRFALPTSRYRVRMNASSCTYLVTPGRTPSECGSPVSGIGDASVCVMLAPGSARPEVLAKCFTDHLGHWHAFVFGPTGEKLLQLGVETYRLDRRKLRAQSRAPAARQGTARPPRAVTRSFTAAGGCSEVFG